MRLAEADLGVHLLGPHVDDIAVGQVTGLEGSVVSPHCFVSRGAVAGDSPAAEPRNCSNAAGLRGQRRSARRASQLPRNCPACTMTTIVATVM